MEQQKQQQSKASDSFATSSVAAALPPPTSSTISADISASTKPTSTAAASASATASSEDISKPEEMILKNIQGIMQKVSLSAVAAGRNPNAVRLVAVSKTKPVPLLQAAYDAGQRHFGENYVHEIVEKSPHLPKDICWHFIGTLQSNKAKELAVVPNLWMVESVSSVKLAKELNKRWTNPDSQLRVLVQVNTSLEESKSGITEVHQCVELVNYILAECPKLKFCGLMTIGLSGDEGCFDTLVKFKKEIYEQVKGLKLAPEEFELSMGMSADFEVAIKKGSTNVRVGSSIFGHRG